MDPPYDNAALVREAREKGWATRTWTEIFPDGRHFATVTVTHWNTKVATEQGLKPRGAPILPADQIEAVRQIRHFIEHGTGKYFILHGLAGTGKTKLLVDLARIYREAVLCTPTNIAARVITEKAGRKAHTLHSLVFKPDGDGVDERGRPFPLFKEKSYYGRLIFLDECGMLSTKNARVLLGKSDKVIAFGDPGQLGPIEDENDPEGSKAFFTEADFELKTVHRQGAGSGIVRQAHEVRHGRPYRSDGDELAVVSTASPEMIRAADVILCWTNEMRRDLNQQARKLRGLSGELQPGEQLMIQRPAYKKGAFYKAQRLTIVSSVPVKGGRRIKVKELDEPVYAAVEGFDIEYRDTGDPTGSPESRWRNHVRLAYASTVNSAQGCQFDNVLMFDDPGHPDRACWLYTGMTRAQRMMTIITGTA